MQKETHEELNKLLERYEEYKSDRKFFGNEKQTCQSIIVSLIHEVLGWETDNPAEFRVEESLR
ncbi:MAG: hypothetical protein ABIA93_01600 [Candidatus Woesearchaeota archaeon]